MPIKRSAFFAVVIAAAAATAYFGYGWLHGKSPLAEPAKATDAKAAPPAKGGGPGGFSGPVPVEVAAAATRALRSEVAAVGTLAANESVVVRPEIAGRISGWKFGQMPGDLVV